MRLVELFKKEAALLMCTKDAHLTLLLIQLLRQQLIFHMHEQAYATFPAIKKPVLRVQRIDAVGYKDRPKNQ